MKPRSIMFVEEWEKAAKRLTQSGHAYGGREPAVLAWLVDFAQMSLDELSAGQRADKAWEVSRFAFDGGMVFTSDNMQPEAKILDFGVAHTEVGGALVQDLSRIQQTLCTALNTFLDVGEAEFPRAEGSFTVSNSRMSEPGRLRFGGSMEATLYFMAGQLLANYGGQLRRCKGCARITLMSRKDKTFCTQACQISTWKRDSLKRFKNSKKGDRRGKKNR